MHIHIYKENKKFKFKSIKSGIKVCIKPICFLTFDPVIVTNLSDKNWYGSQFLPVYDRVQTYASAAGGPLADMRVIAMKMSQIESWSGDMATSMEQIIRSYCTFRGD